MRSWCVGAIPRYDSRATRIINSFMDRKRIPINCDRNRTVSHTPKSNEYSALLPSPPSLLMMFVFYLMVRCFRRSRHTMYLSSKSLSSEINENGAFADWGIKMRRHKLFSHTVFPFRFIFLNICPFLCWCASHRNYYSVGHMAIHSLCSNTNKRKTCCVSSTIPGACAKRPKATKEFRVLHATSPNAQ